MRSTPLTSANIDLRIVVRDHWKRSVSANMAGIGSLVPLLILFAFVAIAAYIGYHISIWSNELADRGKKKLEKKNVSMTADGGLRVKVKEMSSESYADKTQK